MLGWYGWGWQSMLLTWKAVVMEVKVAVLSLLALLMLLLQLLLFAFVDGSCETTTVSTQSCSSRSEF
jgi:hypothetical protein